MSCYHPLKGFHIGYHESGKKKYYITSYECLGILQDLSSNAFMPVFDESFLGHAYNGNLYDRSRIYHTDFIPIPCGHCTGCLLDRSRQWADRCMLEAKYHEHNCFITLTYDDDHLPDTFNSDGVLIDDPQEFHSLNKRDWQLFMKLLRRKIEPIKIRFFMCGEYGSTTFRPHMHAIIFGYDFPDKMLLKMKNGNPYYVSEELNSIWNKGFTTVCNLDWNCAAYVSRYCLKKRDNDLSEFYERFNLIPEFVLMSRKPGIARAYYDDNKLKIYENDEIFLSTSKGSRKIRPPKYFDHLFDIDYPSDMDSIRSKRVEAVENKICEELDRTELSYVDYMAVKEYNHNKRTKIFNERSVKL